MNTSFGSFVLKKATNIKEKRAPIKEPIEYDTRLEFNERRLELSKPRKA